MRGLIRCAIVWTVLLLAARLGFAEEVVMLRPLPERLKEAIVSGHSLVSQRTRLEAASILLEMDRVHLRALRPFRLQEPLDGSVWLSERTRGLPRLTPRPERAIISYLSLQIDLLEMMVSRRDPAAAVELRRGRSVLRMRGKDETVFGDSRDRFVAEVLDHLERISLLQRHLGVARSVDLHFPAEARSSEAVEEYLIGRMREILRRDLEVRGWPQ